MYLEFTSKQLHEYNKLIANIQGCTNPDQHGIIVKMMKCFGKLCDWRASKLKHRGWIGLFKLQIKPMDEYYKYKQATNQQVQVLIDYSNMWLEQFEEWEKQQVEEEKNERTKKIGIEGFAKLLKKKRKK